MILCQEASVNIVFRCSCEVSFSFPLQIVHKGGNIIITRMACDWAVGRKEHTLSQTSALGSALFCIIPSPGRRKRRSWREDQAEPHRHKQITFLKNLHEITGPKADQTSSTKIGQDPRHPVSSVLIGCLDSAIYIFFFFIFKSTTNIPMSNHLLFLFRVRR